ncbi:hypothetical protein [Streptantibioticus silvisoli]|uniref:LapA family protein n=1 Tax=Streptantibioticus silvisoli TaxID=2705255 RepID=A0ABT6VTJ2_9ACTN|nr:hypothetical protein [Streptantibioticus silvisoli]MDI5961790.1 hypothetical protein [Streptantibioticus silvisoli]
MLLLGLLLVAATAAFTGLLIAGNSAGGPDYTPTVLGHSIATMNTMAVFLAGAALALLFCLGLVMMRGGGRRAVRRRAELRAAKREAREAQAERDQLASRAQDGYAEQGYVDRGYVDRSSADRGYVNRGAEERGYVDRGADPVMAEDPTVADERAQDGGLPPEVSGGRGTSHRPGRHLFGH